MRVALDVSSLDHARLSGVGVYIGQLGRALALHPGIDLEGVVPLRRFLKLSTIRKNPFALPVRLWIPGISERGVDIFHGPDFRLPAGVRIPKVLTLHDLAFLEEGMTSTEFARLSRGKVEAALFQGRPARVIAVSHFTRRSILSRYPEWEGRVDVVHHGGDHLLSQAALSFDGHSPGSSQAAPYVFFVGNLEARKNLLGLIRAFQLLKSRRPDFKELRLVLAGKPGFGFEVIREHLDRDSTDIDLKGYQSGPELAALYRGASVFAYPSFHEGFGFPVLEAMGFGVPVLTSRDSAMSEIAGSAAGALVDPASTEEIAAGLERILCDTELRVQAIRSGRLRCSEFLWSDCAARTVEVYRRAIDSD
jgi:alpha-1,3-rhamnosyl/mannosyltransferase